MTRTTIPPRIPPAAYWTCPQAGCSFSAINPTPHPCPLTASYARRRHARVRPYLVDLEWQRRRVDVMRRVIAGLRRHELDRPVWWLRPGVPAAWAQRGVLVGAESAPTAPMAVVA